MKLSKELSKLTETKAFKIGGTVALILLIPLTVFIAQQQQDIRQRAQVVPLTPTTPVVSLAFTPQTANVGVGENVSVDAQLQAGTYKISGVDIVFTFNKNVINVASFTASEKFDTVLYSTVDNDAGTIRFVAVDTTNKAPTGTITLGTITFSTKVLGVSSINTQSTQITASNIPGNLPSTTFPGTYTVIVPTLIPTNTPIPTSTPTPTVVAPTNGPTATPTPSPLPPTNTPVPPTATPTVKIGDVNNDGDIDILDFNIWVNEFKQNLSSKLSDINKDGNIDLLDFNLWRDAFIAQYTPNS